MAENRLRIRLYRILRSPLRSCRSKDQISDVVSTHHHHHHHHLFSPFSYSPAAEARLPFLSPYVSGRKCPPASPIISPHKEFPEHEEKGKSRKSKARFIYRNRAFEDRFPDCKYVNGLFSSDDEEEEKEPPPPPPVEDTTAVVKRSRDPYSDFRSSMVDMIVEKNIIAAKDLENLLRCFLSLNSYHHHKVIIQVFAEIWEAFFLSHEIC